MADPAAKPAPEQQLEMPEPQPVFDVTYQHLYRPGGVFPQMYVFLWVAVAFVVGAILPWAADGSRVILQPVLLVIAVGCVWSSIASIRSRRLTFWPILSIEILAFLFLFLYFGEVKKQDTHLVNLEKERVEAVQDQAAIEHFNAVTKERAGWGFWTISGKAVPAVLFSHVASEERQQFDHAWGKFGVGFHMTWITTGFVALFVLIQLVIGTIKAKPKEDPAAARRAARAAARKGDAGGGDKGSGNKDEDRFFAANTTMKAVTDSDAGGEDAATGDGEGEKGGDDEGVKA